MALSFEVSKVDGTEDDWIVEAVVNEEECQAFVALFTGHEAERRAREYANWKNGPIRQVARSG